MRVTDRDVLAEALEDLYRRYDSREFVHPDPLEFLYKYENPADREIVGLVASSLAYGRVMQILRSVEVILSRMGEPAKFVYDSTDALLFKTFAGFKHRFTTGEEIATLLAGARTLIHDEGSLGAAFERLYEAVGPGEETVAPALTAFVVELTHGAPGSCATLIPLPSEGSACKRLHLYLRWMVRGDNVDPNGWRGVPAGKLIVPLDTHMHRIARMLGFTARKSADIRTAVEITNSFRAFAPDDPVKYDFGLTRLGIRHDEDKGHFFARVGLQGVA